MKSVPVDVASLCQLADGHDLRSNRRPDCVTEVVSEQKQGAGGEIRDAERKPQVAIEEKQAGQQAPKKLLAIPDSTGKDKRPRRINADKRSKTLCTDPRPEYLPYCLRTTKARCLSNSKAESYRYVLRSRVI